MTVKDLEVLYDYGYWANKRLFDVISQMAPEQFTQSVAGSYKSIRNTLVHAMSAEWGWLDRCGGPQRGSPLKADDYPTAETLIESWNKVEKHLREFLSNLSDDVLVGNVDFTIGGSEKRSMPIGELLEHAANHGVHHRGQVAPMLRQLGHAPGNVDILLYFAEKHGAPAL